MQNIIKRALVSLGLLMSIFCLISPASFAETYVFDMPISSLDHDSAYYLGLSQSLSKNETITSASIEFKNINDWRIENNDVLYVDLFQDARYGIGIKTFRDNEVHGDYFKGKNGMFGEMDRLFTYSDDNEYREMIGDEHTKRAGDINNDGKISYVDYLILKDHYGTSIGQLNYLRAADLNKDGRIDFADYLILEANFLKPLYTEYKPGPWINPPEDFIYYFNDDQLKELTNAMQDGKFALGFDPDCHYSLDNVEFRIETSSTPEPASLSLFGLGLAGLLRYRRKK